MQREGWCHSWCKLFMLCVYTLGDKWGVMEDICKNPDAARQFMQAYQEVQAEAEQCHDGMKQLTKDLERAKETNELTEEQYSELQETLQAEENKLTVKTNKIKSLTETVENDEAEIRDKTRGLEEAGKKIEELNEKYTTLQKRCNTQKEELDSKITEMETDLAELRMRDEECKNKIYSAEVARNSALEQLERLKKQQTSSSNDSVIEELQLKKNHLQMVTKEMTVMTSLQKQEIETLNQRLRKATSENTQLKTLLESTQETVKKYRMEIYNATSKAPEYIQLLPEFPDSNGQNIGENLFDKIGRVCESAYLIPSTRGAITEGKENGRHEYLNAILNTALQMELLEDLAQQSKVESAIQSALQEANLKTLVGNNFKVPGKIPKDYHNMSLEIEQYAQPENVAKMVTKYCICATLSNKQWYEHANGNQKEQARVACKAMLNKYETALQFLFGRAKELHDADLHTLKVRNERGYFTFNNLGNFLTGNRMFMLGERKESTYKGTDKNIAKASKYKNYADALDKMETLAASFETRRIIADL